MRRQFLRLLRLLHEKACALRHKAIFFVSLECSLCFAKPSPWLHNYLFSL